MIDLAAWIENCRVRSIANRLLSPPTDTPHSNLCTMASTAILVPNVIQVRRSNPLSHGVLCNEMKWSAPLAPSTS